MRSVFAADATALETLWLYETFSLPPSPGVESQGDLTAFQRMALGFAAERRQELAEQEAGENPAPSTMGQPNAGSQPFGGGKRVEHRSFENLSAKTGKSPEQLISEYSNGS